MVPGPERSGRPGGGIAGMNEIDQIPAGETTADMVQVNVGHKVPIKPLIVFAALALALTIVMCTPLRQYLADLKNIKAQLRSFGFYAPVIFMACVYVLVAIGVPRLLFCPIGGFAFGFVEGLLWTQLATMAGYYTTFLFVRWGGREYVLHHWTKLGRLQKIFDLPAIPAVIICRQLPISGLITNLVLGLAPIRHVDFLVGTAVGILPEAIPFTLVASGAVKLGGGEHIGYVIGAAALLIAVWIGLWYAAGHSRYFARLRRRLRDVETE
jgi:uncharacterized membrane protein YdjX (TVP38/TMEM64 family)